MDEKNWMEVMAREVLAKQVMEINPYTEKFGPTLSREDTEILLAERQHALKTERRVEFGESILPRIIYIFCDSDYLMQDCYQETPVRLQEILYLYKNEMADEITDEELLNFMKEQFETTCQGAGLSGRHVSGHFCPGDTGRLPGALPDRGTGRIFRAGHCEKMGS